MKLIGLQDRKGKVNAGRFSIIWRLGGSGVFEAVFQLLAERSETAHLVQFFDSTTVRAHVSAAGVKAGNRIRHSVALAAGSRPRSI